MHVEVRLEYIVCHRAISDTLSSFILLANVYAEIRKAFDHGASSYPVLFTREQIAVRVAELGDQINRDYAGESVILVGVLKGAAIFLADLARKITFNCTFDFVAVSSYGKSSKSSGAVQLIKDLDRPVQDRNIILVEDILDTGLTLNFLKRHFAGHQPRSLKVAALLDKPSRRIEPVVGDYIGFEIPNEFVVGYGMDYQERFRNLPDICILPSDITLA